ncbi:oxygen-independent coproporphyrinogen III oxidase [Anaerobacillus alkaliphilus]|uniref:Heme chaperone HemW n=1 Tax=Anaerobacillus alkaliphilus TaxID=1548597 RepID=A0A4Q0VQQ2_9BACI|nr:radical SAM family heme chaperone HemW [Anaerobacillus alkaliphilus]RXI99387.1 oxygen-independent coproporphyrinogen III oxidase [Anaerobacillus alkaliphilus]
MPKAVYVHIPFCEQICHYCDFNKVFLKGQPVDEYLEACEREMNELVRRFPTKQIDTIYIGGGTPSALSALQLEKLLGDLVDVFQPKGEFTIELNPGNADEEKLSVIKDAGVNRLSIGVQAFQKDLLEKIGRTHEEKDIYETINNARKYGLDNISIDLMFGLPHQTLEMFAETLRKALELEVPHFSAYSLKIEEKTVFHQLFRKGKLQLPREDEEVAMYDLLIDTLTSNGFHQYEISNFGKVGFESKHNLTYWNNDEYYGIGAGAHGYVYGQRYANAGPIKKYITSVTETGLGMFDQHQVTEQEKIEEEMFLGLRKLEGVSISRFEERFGKSPMDIFAKEIEHLRLQGLLTVEGGRISLSRNGLFLANEVFEKFLL